MPRKTKQPVETNEPIDHMEDDNDIEKPTTPPPPVTPTPTPKPKRKLTEKQLANLAYGRSCVVKYSEERREARRKHIEDLKEYKRVLEEQEKLGLKDVPPSQIADEVKKIKPKPKKKVVYVKEEEDETDEEDDDELNTIIQTKPKKQKKQPINITINTTQPVEQNKRKVPTAIFC